jgi:hypothetical protein
MTSQIALVVDPRFGTRLLDLAKGMPVWIVFSEENEGAVAQARSLLGDAANITSLRSADNESAAETCARGLYEIEEHHGPSSWGPYYDRVLVFGCTPDVLVPDIMENLGLGGIHRSPDGFTVDKLAPQPDRWVQAPT